MATKKSGVDADWSDAAVEAVPATKSGHMIVWQCWIANINATVSWADFLPHETLRMETALGNNERQVNITLHDDAWSIDLVKMEQTNLQTGTTRAIRRVVILKQGVLKD